MGNVTGNKKEGLVIDGRVTKVKESDFKRSKKKFLTEKHLKNMKDVYLVNCNSIANLRNDKSNLDDINMKLGSLKISDKVQKDDLTNYVLLKTIGKGNFGKVLLVKSKLDDNFYALKVLKKVMIIKSKCLERIKTEKRVLEKLDHPFIVKLHSSFHSEDKVFFLMDYTNGGEIFFHLQRKKRFNEDCVKFFAAQLYLALSFLHSNCIIYRDLKPENIMLDQNGCVKLIDFGMVKDKFRSHSPTNTVCGTSEYLPPEVLRGETYGFNFDWWGYGILLYEMLVGVPPFMDDDKKKLYQMIVEDEAPYKFGEQKVPVSSEARDLISKLLGKQPLDRIKPRDIPLHKWFQDVKFDDVLHGKYKSPFIPKIKSLDDYSNFDKEFLNEDCVSPVKKRKDVQEFLHKHEGSEGSLEKNKEEELNGDSYEVPKEGVIYTTNSELTDKSGHREDHEENVKCKKEPNDKDPEKPRKNIFDCILEVKKREKKTHTPVSK